MNFKEIDKEKYCSIKDAVNIVGVTRESIYRYINENRFTEVIKTNQRVFLLRNEVLELKEKRIVEKQRNFIEELEYRISELDIPTNKQETVSLFKEYTIGYISNSGRADKRTILNCYTSTLNTLVEIIDKNIFLYNDDEIKNIIANPKMKSYMHRYFTVFLNYCKLKKKDNCLFKNRYSYTEKTKVKLDKDIYSFEVFMSYYDYVKDIDFHIFNAINNIVYAETWFYISMHFINAWRCGDIVFFPNIYLEEIGINNFEWFKDNKLTLSKSQLVINQVADKWELLKISKTGALNRFIVNNDMIIPIANMIIILEIHRRIKGNQYLLQDFIKKRPTKRHYEIFFINKPDLVNFLSLKANRSLLTYFFHNVSKSENNGDISNLLTSKMRGHKDNNTISNYIMNTNEDGILDNVSYHLFRRGHFGWLYASLVDIVMANKENKLTMEEKTRLIENYQKLYTPQQIESLSKFLLLQQSKNKTIAMELALMPEKELENKLNKIYKGEMPSKVENGQCLYSDKCVNCTGSCFNCPYLIPKTYILVSVKDELIRIINVLFKIEIYNTAERTKYSFLLFKLMDLLNQCVVSYGKNYVESYINLKDLKYQLEKVNNKLLINRG